MPASCLLSLIQYNDIHYCLQRKQRREKVCAVTANALCDYCSGSKGDWSASTDSPCLGFGHKWWWSYPAGTRDLLLPKHLEFFMAVCPELCGCRRALSAFSTHLCSAWTPCHWFFTGTWGKKVDVPPWGLFPKIAVARSAWTEKQLTEIQFGVLLFWLS